MATSRTDWREDSLLDAVGHELRNPLNAISAATEVLRMTEGSHPVAADACQVLQRQVRKLARTIDEALDLLRLQAVEKPAGGLAVELGGLAQECAAVLAQHRSAAAPEITLALQAVWVEADRGQLARVLRLLIGHAVKRAPAGSRVGLRVTPVGDDAEVELSDSGVPIAATMRACLFECPEQSGYGDAPGADRMAAFGLGLAGRWVRQQGGQIGAASDAGGTRITLRLPRQSDGERPSASRPSRARRLLLAVGQDREALQGIAHAVASRGHLVANAPDAEQALAQLLSDPPQVAIIAIDTPGLNGLELARCSRAAGYPGKLVALMSRDETVRRRAAMRAGFDAALAWPPEAEAWEKLFDD